MAAIVGFTALYLYAVYQTRQKRLPLDWQIKEVEHKNLWNVSARRARHISHRLIGKTGDLDREDQVWLLTRQKKLVLLIRILLPLLLSAFFFGISLVVGDVNFNLPHHHGHAPKSQLPDIKPAFGPKNNPLNFRFHSPTAIPWWFWVTLGLVCLVFAWYLSLDWQSRFMMVTNRRFYLFREPPIYLPMMAEEDHPLPLIRVNEPEVIGSPIAKVLGVARLSLGTNMQADEDAPFKHLVGWPHPDEIAKIISQLLPDPTSNTT
jgi:hypothetical protein